MVFTKNEKPVNLLNLQNLLTYENSYKVEIVLSAFKLQGSGLARGAAHPLITFESFA